VHEGQLYAQEDHLGVRKGYPLSKRTPTVREREDSEKKWKIRHSDSLRGHENKENQIKRKFAVG